MHGYTGFNAVNGSGKDKNSLFFDFSLSILGFARTCIKSARRSGVTLVEYDLMLAIRACPQGTSPSITVLCERLVIHHHVASETVAGLVARNLLKTRRNGHDKRSVSLSLTAAGELLLRQIALQSLQHLQRQSQRIEHSLATIIER